MNFIENLKRRRHLSCWKPDLEPGESIVWKCSMAMDIPGASSGNLHDDRLVYFTNRRILWTYWRRTWQPMPEIRYESIESVKTDIDTQEDGTVTLIKSGGTISSYRPNLTVVIDGRATTVRRPVSFQHSGLDCFIVSYLEGKMNREVCFITRDSKTGRVCVDVLTDAMANCPPRTTPDGMLF